MRADAAAQPMASSHGKQTKAAKNSGRCRIEFNVSASVEVGYFFAGGKSVQLPCGTSAAITPLCVAARGRYTWIFAVVAAVLCVLLGVVTGIKLWRSLCAFSSALTITAVAARQRDLPALGAGICMVLAFATFAARLSAGPLRPGEFLHIGRPLSMVLLERWTAARPQVSAGIGLAA